MKRTLSLLGVFLLVAAGLYWAFQQSEQSQDLAGVTALDLLHDASQPADPDQAGPIWPTDDVLAGMRREWSRLSPADSTMLDGLTMEWMHPEGRASKALVTAGEIRGGRDLTLEDRLRLGENLVKHPRWRTGVMRNYPALAGVITPLEKNVLRLTARGGKTAAEMARGLGVSASEVQTTAQAWVQAGWLREHEVDGGIRYQAVDGTVVNGGALEFVSVRYRGKDPRCFATLDAALEREGEAIKSQWVTFSGICPESGKPVRVVLAAGRLRSGKPAAVYTAHVEQPGRAAGMFASKEAFTHWSQEHPGVLGEGRPAVELFKEFLAES